MCGEIHADFSLIVATIQELVSLERNSYDFHKLFLRLVNLFSRISMVPFMSQKTINMIYPADY
ncbi:hypothetical protein B7P43_G16739 [Cryptotermes secundus]|uniref:Uncharacterized protein n=1 Tax=Cryptotermes secundus TaxID=105785 RepID=A0A2J7QM08_9NEOP|nr:hypothetical protein B7P43_G16739 [Cryptotermes secundus]